AGREIGLFQEIPMFVRNRHSSLKPSSKRILRSAVAMEPLDRRVMMSVTELPIPIIDVLSSRPEGITRGPDGNLWFTESDANRIGRITTAGVVTQFSAGITPNSQPAQITARPDGKLWVTQTRGETGRPVTPAGVPAARSPRLHR